MCGGFQLSRKQRLMGFGVLFVSGFFVSFLSTFLLISLKLTAFAVLYSIGNIMSLMATGFLIGFASQFKVIFV
jgi:hypothetical protein